MARVQQVPSRKASAAIWYLSLLSGIGIALTFNFILKPYLFDAYGLGAGYYYISIVIVYVLLLVSAWFLRRMASSVSAFLPLVPFTTNSTTTTTTGPDLALSYNTVLQLLGLLVIVVIFLTIFIVLRHAGFFENKSLDKDHVWEWPF